MHTAVVLVRNATFTLLAVLAAAGPARSQSAGAPPATPPRPAPTMPPVLTALSKATTIKDPAERLAALNKVRVDFNYPQVDATILTTLVSSFPDRTDSIRAVFDRIIERIPPSPIDARLSQIISPVSIAMRSRPLLERSEQLLTEVLTAFTFDTYVASRRETAQRLNQAPPSDTILSVAFKTGRARGLETLGRVQLFRGDTARAEATLKQAVDANRTYGMASMSLVELYNSRNDFASAERLLLDAIAAASVPPPTLPPGERIMPTTIISSGGVSGVAAPMMSLANLYAKRGDDAKAEALYTGVLTKSPASKPALVAIARLEDKRGDHTAALRHLLLGAVLPGSMATPDDSLMRRLYQAARGPSAHIDDDLDSLYRAQFPNPVKTEHYAASAGRSDRVVMLEMFTGAGCAPCVSADLALEGVMERYPQDAIIAINYHANIPAPDPMVVSGGDGRREYYKVRGVPTFNIDGALGQLGGGARVQAQSTYARYIPKIDSALMIPARAAIAVSATGTGDGITATVKIEKLAANQKDLRLHILLVERDLRYSGENGVRFHPMVVRAVAGERGAGIAIQGNTTASYAFNLEAIRKDVAATLTAEIAKRRLTSPLASYAAERNAYTRIDPSQLVVVAFIQQGPYYPDGAPGATPAGFETNGDDDPAPPAPAGAGVPGPNILQAAKANVVFKK
jgi:tetratricopeptide (TPR) repeat protein